MKRTTLMADAAKAIGRNRKTLQRWRKIKGSPFDSDGACDVAELSAWAIEAGLMERVTAGRPPEIVRELQVAGAGSGPAASPILAPDLGPSVAPAIPPVEGVEALTEADREALAALMAGDARKLIDLARSMNPKLLGRLAAMGRARTQLAEAERKELDNRRTRRELVPIDDVKKFWAGQIQLVKTHFSALPGKLAPRLVDQGYDSIYQVLEDELHALLVTFSSEVPA